VDLRPRLQFLRPLLAGSVWPAFERHRPEQVKQPDSLLLDFSLGSALTALEANLNTDLRAGGAAGEILAGRAVMQPLPPSRRAAALELGVGEAIWWACATSPEAA